MEAATAAQPRRKTFLSHCFGLIALSSAAAIPCATTVGGGGSATARASRTGACIAANIGTVVRRALSRPSRAPARRDRLLVNAPEGMPARLHCSNGGADMTIKTDRLLQLCLAVLWCSGPAVAQRVDILGPLVRKYVRV